MKKNGFTLIELIGIITLMAIIGLVVFPSIANVTKQSEEKKRKENLNSIYIATESYITSNAENFDSLNTKGNYEYIKVLTLVNEEYVKHDMLNPNTNEGFNAYDVVKVTRNEDDTYSFSLTKLNGIYDVAKGLVYSNDICKTDGTTYQYMGGCYLKGAQSSNYVWYSGFLWRIMGINSDSTVRLTSEENLTSIAYNATPTFVDSYAEKWLNAYFISKIQDPSIITTYRNWCLPIATTASTSDTTCTGNTYTDRVGLLNIDEVNLAGGTNSYLKNSQNFSTLTPYSETNLWYVNTGGTLSNSVSTDMHGLRAVINIKSDAIVNEGEGSLNNPYLLNKNSNNVTGLLYNHVTSGEYIKFENNIYRVVGINNDGSIKIIFDNYYKDTLDTDYYNVGFGTDNTFTLGSGIGQLLNTTVLNQLVTKQENRKKLVDNAKWYQGKLVNVGSFETALDETLSPVEATVGLIRMGEMLSNQSETILSRKHDYANDQSKAKNYWTLTPYTSTNYAYTINQNGIASYVGIGSGVYIRPVINIKSTVQIISGNGTYTNPYEI